MMKHTNSNVTVYATNDYDRFSLISGNRPINLTKIKRIIADIEGGNDMLEYYPIQVRENKNKLEIMDGQHRFMISKKMKRPVHYIMLKESKTISDIATVNSNVERWKPENFINCYITRGNDNYSRLKAFSEKYGINVGTSINMLQEGTVKTKKKWAVIQQEFQRGKFQVMHHAKAVSIAETCKKFECFSQWNSREFIVAITAIQKANLVNIDELAAKVCKNQETLTSQSTWKNYIILLEQIASIGKQKTVRLV